MAVTAATASSTAAALKSCTAAPAWDATGCGAKKRDAPAEPTSSLNSWSAGGGALVAARPAAAGGLAAARLTCGAPAPANLPAEEKERSEFWCLTAAQPRA